MVHCVGLYLVFATRVATIMYITAFHIICHSPTLYNCINHSTLSQVLSRNSQTKARPRSIHATFHSSALPVEVLPRQVCCCVRAGADGPFPLPSITITKFVVIGLRRCVVRTHDLKSTSSFGHNTSNTSNLAQKQIVHDRSIIKSSYISNDITRK